MSSVNAEALRELHRIHRQLTDLRGRLSRGPKQIKAGTANLERLESEFAAAKEALTRAKVASDDKQLQLKQREDRIAELNKKLNSAASNREYQALKEQIAADEQANSVLSDEILEMLEKLDEMTGSVAELEGNLNRHRDDLDQVRKRVSDQQQTLESELARVTANLETAEAGLPAEFKPEYLRMTEARGEDALAEVDGEVCSVCHQMLSPQTLNELSLGKPVLCKSCGALLYMAEDRSV